MKVLQTAVALVPVAMMVALQGCGGADRKAGPPADKCTIKNPAVEPEFDCEAVSEECCAILNSDAKMVGGAAEGSVGKCGRNDQVGLFNCIKPRGLKLCTNSPAVGEGTDGVGTCKITAKGKVSSVPGVSTGCCTAINSAAAVKGATKGEVKSLKAQQKDIDAVCGLIGACGRKDQDGMEKVGKKMMGKGHGKGNGTGKGGAVIVDLLTYMPPTESTLGQEMTALLEHLPPIAEFPETEAFEEEPSVTEYQSGGMATIGFVAGAAFTALGLVARNRRKQTHLEEPLTA